MKRNTRLILGGLVILLAGCASHTTNLGTPDIVAIPGLLDSASLTPAELRAAIEVAYLDGQLSAEQASRARLKLEALRPSSHATSSNGI